jgi:hypothetical protein
MLVYDIPLVWCVIFLNISPDLDGYRAQKVKLPVRKLAQQHFATFRFVWPKWFMFMEVVWPDTRHFRHLQGTQLKTQETTREKNNRNAGIFGFFNDRLLSSRYQV